MHYPPETTSIMLIARILATLIQSSEKADFRSRLMALCHRTVSEEDAIAHKLLGKEFESQLEQLRDLTAKTFQAPEVAEVVLSILPIVSCSILQFCTAFDCGWIPVPLCLDRPQRPGYRDEQL